MVLINKPQPEVAYFMILWLFKHDLWLEVKKLSAKSDIINALSLSIQPTFPLPGLEVIGIQLQQEMSSGPPIPPPPPHPHRPRSFCPTFVPHVPSCLHFVDSD